MVPVACTMVSIPRWHSQSLSHHPTFGFAPGAESPPFTWWPWDWMGSTCAGFEPESFPTHVSLSNPFSSPFRKGTSSGSSVVKPNVDVRSSDTCADVDITVDVA